MESDNKHYQQHYKSDYRIFVQWHFFAVSAFKKTQVLEHVVFASIISYTAMETT